MNGVVKLNRKKQSEFNRTLGVFFKKSKRSIYEILEEQARGIVIKTIRRTPPMSGKRQGTTARKKGEENVKKQISRVLKGVHARSKDGKKARTVTQSQMRAYHEKFRKAGQIRGRGRKKQLKVTKAALNKYIRSRQKKVGSLAAGWVKVARQFKAGQRNIPAWVRRHNMPSVARVKISNRRINIRFTNQVKFSGDLEKHVRALNSALNAQTRAIRRRLEFSVKQAAKQSGL